MTVIYGKDHRLSDDIAQQCQSLFVEYQAEVVDESPYPQPFGNAWVIVRVRDFLLRFSWDRGSTTVEIKSAQSKGTWEWLDALIGAMAPSVWTDWCDLFITNYV